MIGWILFLVSVLTLIELAYGKDQVKKGLILLVLVVGLVLAFGII